MKLTADSPEFDCVMIAFNGEIVGWVVEADDVEGYIIQFKPHAVSEHRRVKRHGKVTFLGNCELDDRDLLMKRFNEHRVACGLPPYAEA